MVTLRRNPARAGFIALGMVSALTLAGCADTAGGGTGGGSGEGVEYGATEEEYQAAFADVAPIELTTQTPSPKGSVTGKPMEDYFKAITEWSDGKITFDIAYSNARVPEPAESDDALLDGRLDVASVLPLYEPSEYPANAELVKATLVSNQSAVAGTLQSNAWPNEVAFATPEVMREFEDQGIKLMLPQYNSGVNVQFCSKPRRTLAELKGMQAASGGEAQSAVVEAVGGKPASVQYTELYESLQRGVVDCAVSSLTVGVLGGFIKAAPHVTVDPDAGFALAPGTMAISQARWDSLPLVARQLLWDRMDVFMTSNIEGKIWPNIVEAVSQAKAAGGSVAPFGPDARRAVNDANAKLLDQIRNSKRVADAGTFVDNIQASADKWLRAVDELGISGDVPYSEFDDWYEDGKVDVDAYVKKMYEEILLEHRPS